MYVCPSTWNNLAPTVSIFVKIGIWAFFEKSVEKMHEALKYYNICYFTSKSMYIYDNLSLIYS
jgi:hypothetical protein